MEYYMILGIVVAALITLLGFYFSIKKEIKADLQTSSGPIQELNLSITRLNDHIDHMVIMDENRDKRIEKHGQQIDAMIEKQRMNEKLLDRHELRIVRLEEYHKVGNQSSQN